MGFMNVMGDLARQKRAREQAAIKNAMAMMQSGFMPRAQSGSVAPPQPQQAEPTGLQQPNPPGLLQRLIGGARGVVGDVAQNAQRAFTPRFTFDPNDYVAAPFHPGEVSLTENERNNETRNKEISLTHEERQSALEETKRQFDATQAAKAQERGDWKAVQDRLADLKEEAQKNTVTLTNKQIDADSELAWFKARFDNIMRLKGVKLQEMRVKQDGTVLLKGSDGTTYEYDKTNRSMRKMAGPDPVGNLQKRTALVGLLAQLKPLVEQSGDDALMRQFQQIMDSYELGTGGEPGPEGGLLDKQADAITGEIE